MISLVSGLQADLRKEFFPKLFRVRRKKNWLIKYALNTHMWCAIIVNKQTSPCATRKSKNKIGRRKKCTEEFP